MTMKTRYILMTALLAMASCTNTDYIDVEEVDAVMVVNSQMLTSNSSHTVVLSSGTLSRLSEVNGADVSVSVNGAAPFKAAEDNKEEEEYGYGLQNGTKYRFDYSFAPGDVVDMTITHKSGAKTNASVTVPKDPIVKKAELFHEVPHKSSDSMFDFGWDYYYTYPMDDDNPYPNDSWHELRVTLQDIPSEDSYYRIDVAVEYILTDGEEVEKGARGVWLDTSSEPVLTPATSSGGILDALAEDSNNYNAFSDNVFKDKEYTLKLFFQESQVSYMRHYYNVYEANWTEVEVKDEKTGQTYTKYVPEPLPEGVTYSTQMRVRVYSISHDQYIYLKALGMQDMAMFFSEPISIPSNVEGGMGFVNIDSCKEIRLEY